MRILLSNDPDFALSAWYLDIQQGAQYPYLPAHPDGSATVSAKYFKLENIPSSWEIEIGSGYMLDPGHFFTRIVLRTTNFSTNTGVIEYLSALIHPGGVIAPGVFKITGNDATTDNHIFTKMNIR
ncbi:hypothetical protein OIU19_25075 [Pseudomonas sp. BT-42-2]|uniref:hypothetical protein n=1 Tax=Pseudomonas sp. BT-42-2 TaxID=2986927 RepID=UPI0021F72086|nr:hypothetical protein [Pseudomonas sp. BT-42-2]MCV9922039.1 hypothetical protein [Pseudomonas sp. BT-42-2]